MGGGFSKADLSFWTTERTYTEQNSAIGRTTHWTAKDAATEQRRWRERASNSALLGPPNRAVVATDPERGLLLRRLRRRGCASSEELVAESMWERESS